MICCSTHDQSGIVTLAHAPFPKMKHGSALRNANLKQSCINNLRRTFNTTVNMPPRKKATTTVAAPAPTRASARNKSSRSSTQPATPSQPPTASKPKSKRAHDAESESEDDGHTSKPVSKKARTTKKQDADTQDDQAVDTSSQPVPASDEPKKMVTDTSIGLLLISS